ncbi:GNAT family N-acetyltransferase [Notoacmeibacter sp. MSK16QG-6]|uniref:GNAT family N-acetyltransferase n=1 Tax=Notoacmeibacter sp. MSK16QG-6 TaxID=2957982 RepID=UPI00209D2B01|nr:GNAT family N-acetyltransferase [Notoacmeibacter sp. MSK16QG-6]MCP1198440.1 GNAT family N-acetyltransferase [Notoacmeibacter sp. MSK16QG-6]
MNQTITRQKITRRKVPAPQIMPFFTGNGWRLVEGPEGHALHQTLAKDAAAFGAPQGPHWAEAWEKATAAQIIYAVHVDDGLPVVSLPLDIRSSSGITVAALPGGSHANGCFPVMAKFANSDIDPNGLGEILREFHPEIDAVILERMHTEMNGFANPFLPLRTNISVDPDLAADLKGGWDAWLKRNSGKKKRKKHRQDYSALEALGAVSFEVLSESSEICAALDTFFAMKAERFREIGVRDVFADETIQAFFHRLAAGYAGSGGRQFDLSVLRIDDRPIAIGGHSLLPDRMICEFSAFEPVETGIRSVSPSLYMHFESIKRAANDGYRFYDFSVGDEPYKQRWCDTRTELFDVAVGLTLKGRAFASAHNLVARSKRRIKSNGAATQILQKLRRASFLIKLLPGSFRWPSPVPSRSRWSDCGNRHREAL